MPPRRRYQPGPASLPVRAQRKCRAAATPFDSAGACRSPAPSGSMTSPSASPAALSCAAETMLRPRSPTMVRLHCIRPSLHPTGQAAPGTRTDRHGIRVTQLQLGGGVRVFPPPNSCGQVTHDGAGWVGNFGADWAALLRLWGLSCREVLLWPTPPSSLLRKYWKKYAAAILPGRRMRGARKKWPRLTRTLGACERNGCVWRLIGESKNDPPGASGRWWTQPTIQRSRRCATDAAWKSAPSNQA